MYLREPSIIAVGALNLPICKFVKCGGYNEADVALCLSQGACIDLKAQIIINVKECEWASNLRLGNEEYVTLKCCPGECLTYRGNSIVFNVNIPKIYMYTPRPLIDDLRRLWSSLMVNSGVLALARIVIEERANGASATLRRLIMAQQRGYIDDVRPDVKSILTMLGVIRPGGLVDRDYLKSVIQQVIRLVYP